MRMLNEQIQMEFTSCTIEFCNIFWRSSHLISWKTQVVFSNEAWQCGKNIAQLWSNLSSDAPHIYLFLLLYTSQLDGIYLTYLCILYFVWFSVRFFFTIHHITILRQFRVVILLVCVNVTFSSYVWNYKCVTERPSEHTYAAIIAKNAHNMTEKMFVH